MSNYRFPKRVRLLRASDFERVFAARASAGDGLIVVHGLANELGHPRLGMTVSRRLGGAVARNRWKRALREAFRLSQHELPALDLVCVPRPQARADVRQLVTSLLNLAGRVNAKLEHRSRSGAKPTVPQAGQPPASPR